MKNSLMRGMGVMIMVNLVISMSFKIEKQESLKNLKTSSFEKNIVGENQTIGQFMEDIKFSGRYNVNNDGRIFDYLDSKEGQIDMFFQYDPQSRLNNTNVHPNFVTIFIFDPMYMDEKVVGFNLPLSNIQNSTWQATLNQLNVTYYYKQTIQQQKNFNATRIYFNISVQSIQSQNVNKVFITINMEGQKINFKASTTVYNNLIPNLGYSFFSTFITCIQIVSGFFMIKKMETLNFSFGAKLSLITLGLCAIEDFNLAMVHIQEIMNLTGQFFLFLLPGFAYVILVVGIDMRMIFSSWRGHNISALHDFRVLRKKLTLFYLKFYLGLFGYMVLLYFFAYDGWFIVIQQLLLIPQIIRNARKGSDPGFSKLYAFGYVGTRYIMLIYNRGCPSNYFRLVPIPGIVISVCCIYAFCVLIMYTQHKVGARFFIPKEWQPNYFNYYQQIQRNQMNKELQCAICLQGIFQKNEGINGSYTQIESILLDKCKIMKTPCGHSFHQECLKEWLAVKLQCPSCRSALPILI